MLSIESGDVYTESYSLSHMMTAAFSPQNKQSGFGFCRYLSHRHILLTKCAIPEEKTSSPPAELFYGGNNFLPTFPAIVSS
jgi:hypothetical protein